MRRTLYAFGLVSFWLILSALAPAMPHERHSQRKETFRIEGAIAKPGDWSRERLEKEFAADLKTVAYTLKGEKGEARCIPLLSLVQAAHLRLNAKIKNHPLAFVVIVRADDGYTVTFSMGELLPANGKREVWLALDRDGMPLDKDEAPVQLLVPEDEKSSRWVHGVASITIVDGFQAINKKRK